MEDTFSFQVYFEGSLDQMSVCLFIKQLFIACYNVSGTVLCTGDIGTDKAPDLKELIDDIFLRGKQTPNR